MSSSAIGTRRQTLASPGATAPSYVESLEGHQIRRLALAAAALSWGGILFLFL